MNCSTGTAELYWIESHCIALCLLHSLYCMFFNSVEMSVVVEASCPGRILCQVTEPFKLMKLVLQEKEDNR